MTPAHFAQWLADMKSAGRARYDADCARMLKVTPNGLLKMKKHGTTRQTDLACAALLAGLPPYGEDQSDPGIK